MEKFNQIYELAQERWGYLFAHHGTRKNVPTLSKKGSRLIVNYGDEQMEIDLSQEDQVTVSYYSRPVSEMVEQTLLFTKPEALNWVNPDFFGIVTGQADRAAYRDLVQLIVEVHVSNGYFKNLASNQILTVPLWNKKRRLVASPAF